MAKQDSIKKPLNSLTLKNLKSGTLSDTAPHSGLRIGVNKSGSKTWFYRYRSPHTNKLRRIKLGSYPAMSLSEARASLMQQKKKREQGIDPQDQKKADRKQKQHEAKLAKQNEYTFADLIEDYLTRHIEPNRKKKGAAEVRRSLYGDPVKVLGATPAIEVGCSELLEMIMSVVNRGANVQAGFILRELTAAIDYSIGEKLPDDFVNPCYQVKGLLKRKRIRLTSQRGKRVLNDSELAALLKWLLNSLFTQGQKGIIHLTLMTGCRTGEVCDLRWKDLDLDKAVWHLQATKTEVPRTVQLSKQAVELLRGLERLTGDYVFVNIKGAKVQQKTLTETQWRIRKAEKDLNIEQWTPHDLRRSVATGISRLGCPSEVVEAVLGHTKNGVEGIYNLHKYEEQCREWLQKWSDHLDLLTGRDTSGTGNGKG